MLTKSYTFYNSTEKGLTQTVYRTITTQDLNISSTGCRGHNRHSAHYLLDTKHRMQTKMKTTEEMTAKMP